MVLYDPYEGQTQQNKRTLTALSPIYALASPQDRLAAIVVDYLLLIPVLSLALAPLKRIFYVGQLLGQDFYFHFELFFAVLVILTVCIAYQTLFVYFKGATPGKMLLKIRVVSIWPGRKISLMEAALRSLVWWAETVLLFIPHLAVSSGHRRRPPHDRLADTVVITNRWQAVSEPTIAEANFARGMMHAALICLLCVGALNVIEIAHEPAHEVSGEMASSDKSECGLSDDLRIDGSNVEMQDLESQLALFAIGRYAPTCLQTQADRVLSKHPDNGEAYLAKAFAFADDQERSDEYLDEVCASDGESQACQFSTVVANWNSADWKTTTQSLTAMMAKAPAFVRFWAVRHFFKTRDFKRVLEVLDGAPVAQAYANFVLNHRFKSLWLLGKKTEARLVYEAHIQHLSLEDKLDPTSWMCEQELSAGCEGRKSESCRNFSQFTSGRESETLTSYALALTDIKIKMCNEGPKFNYQTEYFESFPSEARQYIRGLELAHEEKWDEARAQMEEIAELDDTNAVTVEARLQLVRWAHESRDLVSVYDMWQDQDPFQSGWSELGQGLMERYSEFKAFDQSFDVGMALYGSNLATPTFLHRLAEVSELSRHSETIRDIARSLKESDRSRQPASEGDP